MPEILAAGFTVLNLLTADRNAGVGDRTRRIPAARIVSRRRVLHGSPSCRPDGLTGAGVFWDGQMQNPPRLVWAMVPRRPRGRAP